MTDKKDLPILRLKELVTGYGKKEIVHSVSLEVGRKEIVALIGHNGAGKSTILKTVLGLLKSWEGNILFREEDITSWPNTRRVKVGIHLIPQGRQIFSELSVQENLEMGGYFLDKTTLLDRTDFALQFFPKLGDRLKQLAGKLSGGEQQMLAFASALILRPTILLLDEPSLGLSPHLVSKTFFEIKRINKELDTPVLIVDQKVKKILQIADRTYVLKLGKITYDGPSKNLLDKERLRQVFF